MLALSSKMVDQMVEGSGRSLVYPHTVATGAPNGQHCGTSGVQQEQDWAEEEHHEIRGVADDNLPDKQVFDDVELRDGTCAAERCLVVLSTSAEEKDESAAVASSRPSDEPPLMAWLFEAVLGDRPSAVNQRLGQRESYSLCEVADADGEHAYLADAPPTSLHCFR